MDDNASGALGSRSETQTMSDPEQFGAEEGTSAFSDFCYIADERDIARWESAFPVAYRLYWVMRDAMAEQDGKRNRRHHAAAVFAVHDSFPSKPERERLGLPATTEELATLLGVSSRLLRGHRQRYAGIFATTRHALRESFLGGYYGRVYEALGETAATTGRDGAADRRLFMQLTGDLVERHDMTSGNKPISFVVEERLDAPG